MEKDRKREGEQSRESIIRLMRREEMEERGRKDWSTKCIPTLKY